MPHLVSRFFKVSLWVLVIYLITLIFFLIDTSRVVAQARDLATSLKTDTTTQSDIDGFANKLKRYSHSLDSPLLSIPSFVLGDTDSISKLGQVMNSAAMALEVIAPLIPRDIEQVKLTDTELLARDVRILKRASRYLENAFEEFSTIEFSGVFTALTPRLSHLQNKVSKYQQVLERTSPLLPILPDFLGNYTKRTYFVAMQNSAQARGTGGLIGTFALISFEKGSMSLDYVAPNSELEIQSDIPIEVPEEYRSIYQDYAKSWNGSNFSPHFPYAAQIWAETWRRMTGQKVDGVISVDTFTLRALLAATGPIDFDEFQITKENVIYELLSAAYTRFETNPEKRKSYLTEIARSVAQRFIEGNYSRTTLLREIIDPILENRILVYSPYAREARYLGLTPISGILDDAPNNEFRLVIQNIAGNKLDYYLAREVTVMSERCSPIRTTRVDFSVTNTADPDTPLPAYVNALRAQGFPQGDRNKQFAGIFLYGPSNARISGAVDIDTGKTYGRVFTERNRPLYSVQVMIPAGTSKRFSVYFEGGAGAITTVVQPLVLPQKTTIADSC